jgi:hypothetical protein
MSSVVVIDALTEGIWRWTAPHPEWHRADPWTHEVACFAVAAGDELVLVDPLAPPDAGPFWSELDRLVERTGAARMTVMLTIHYHLRSAGEVSRRYGERLGVTVHGHESVAGMLDRGVRFEAIEPGAELPAGAQAFAIGSPRRREMPLLFPSARALAFGDAVVGVDGDLRVWQDLDGGRRRDWYERRLLPTLRPLAELDFDHVLVTHGPPIVGHGPEKLRRGLAAPAWNRAPG